MEVHGSSHKRRKQACKNCRRKKARCPGEQPTCSFCERLKQECEYDEVPVKRKCGKTGNGQKQSKLAARLTELEEKLSVLTGAHVLKHHATLAGQPALTESPSTSTATEWRQSAPQNLRSCLTSANESNSSSFEFHELPPRHIVLAAIELYFAHCHNHPLAFFYEDNFRHAFHHDSIPFYLLLALVSTTARMGPETWFEGTRSEASRAYARLAWTAVLSQVVSGREAKTNAAVQTLGLLALIDYQEGLQDEAAMKLRLAISMAQSLQLMLEPSPALPPMQQEEQRYLAWTLHIIDRMAALTFNQTVTLSERHCLLKLPEEESVFRQRLQNGMPTITELEAAVEPTKIGDFAKMVYATSVLGSLAMLSHQQRFQRGRCGLAIYAGLVTTATQLAKVLRIDTQSANTRTQSRISVRTSERLAGSSQAQYARAIYHLIQVLVQHPLTIRQWLPWSNKGKSDLILRNALAECHKHAALLSEALTTDTGSTCSASLKFFSGFMTFNASLVHCLFTHSSDEVTSQISRKCLHQMRVLLEQNPDLDDCLFPKPFVSTIDGLTQSPEDLGRFTDPQVVQIENISPGDGAWRFLDHDWLHQRLGLSGATAAAVEAQSKTPLRETRLVPVSTTRTAEALSAASCSPHTPMPPYQLPKRTSTSRYGGMADEKSAMSNPDVPGHMQHHKYPDFGQVLPKSINLGESTSSICSGGGGALATRRHAMCDQFGVAADSGASSVNMLGETVTGMTPWTWSGQHEYPPWDDYRYAQISGDAQPLEVDDGDPCLH